MKSNHKTIEQRLELAAQSIAVPSREQFKPIFESVTKHGVVRSPYKRFFGLIHKVTAMNRMQKTWTLSLMTSIAVVLIVIIPTVSQPQQELVSFQTETISSEASQELRSLDQEDSIVEAIVESSLGQMAALGETQD